VVPEWGSFCGVAGTSVRVTNPDACAVPIECIVESFEDKIRRLGDYLSQSKINASI
jgi:hypothetical protein